MRSESERPLRGYARFADGLTAGSTVVPITLAERGIAIDTGKPEPLIWPYGALEAAVPLSAGLSRDALITYRHQPGATLFIEEPALIAALTDRARQLSTAAHRRRWAIPVVVGTLLAVLAAIAVSLSNLRPATTISGWIPRETRETLGRQVVASLTRSHKRCEAPAGIAALERMVARLRIDGSNVRFDVRVVDWDLINAFAAPGGQIVLTRGLIAKAEGPDEVAAVLSHEMGHGLKLHPEAGIIRSLGIGAIVDLMIGGGGSTLSNLGALMAELSYSRDAEREADAIGLQLLRGAGIPAGGLASFFERVEERKIQRDAQGEEADKKTGWSRAFEIFSTHPLTEERIANARKVAPYPSSPALGAEDWLALKGICTGSVAAPGKTDN